MSDISRRSLVRTGVTSAWTVPLVMVGVPAAYAACSGGVTQLAAVEVVGTRFQTFDDGTALIDLSVSVQLTNTGIAGKLVSASVSGTNGERMLLLSIGTVALGTVGFVTAPEPGTELLTVTTSPTVPLGSPVILVHFQCGDLSGTQTFQVSFQPDCGQPAVCSFVVVFDG